MKSAYWITTAFHPAITVPAGFTEDGLPVGLQIRPMNVRVLPLGFL